MKKLIKAEFYKLQKLFSIRLIILAVFSIGMLRGFSPGSGYQVYIMSLFPELFDMLLISIFTAAFLCMEFSNRTFGNSFLCGSPRWKILFAKLVVYFLGLLVFILVPLAVSTSVASVRNGFGADGAALVWEMAVKLLFYILYRFSMAGFAVLAAVVIQNPVGTLGISAAGVYLMVLVRNPGISLYLQGFDLDALLFLVREVVAFFLEAVGFLFAAVFIFIRRDFS